MRTAIGKLAWIVALVLAAIVLFAPVRYGREDAIVPSARSLTLNPGDIVEIDYALQAETAQTVRYSSEDPGVAKVTQLGRITAVEPGDTVVVLRAEGGAEARVDVHVNGVAVTEFSLNADAIELEKGEVSGLSPIFNAGATDTRVLWRSADPTIAAVDSAGRITAVGGGETQIVAQTPNGMAAVATVRVHVASTAAMIVPDGLTVGVGAACTLGTRYLPEDATDTVVSWSSSDSRVLSVDRNGRVRAVSTGVATITAVTRDGQTATTEMTVEPAARNFQIIPTEIVLERGDTHTIEALFLNEDGQADASVQHHIEWSCSDPDVVALDEGTLTALKTGMATVTVSADGMERTCLVRVRTQVRSVEFSMGELYLLREQTGTPFQLTATVEPQDADDTSLVYITDNPQVAVVSDTGVVTLSGGYGTAVITARAASGAEAHFTVHVVTELPRENGN